MRAQDDMEASEEPPTGWKSFSVLALRPQRLFKPKKKGIFLPAKIPFSEITDDWRLYLLADDTRVHNVTHDSSLARVP